MPALGHGTNDTDATNTITRVYRYGLLEPERESWPLIEQQLRASNDYWNALAELTRCERAAKREALGPAHHAAQLAAEDAWAAYEQERDAIKADRSALRRRDVDASKLKPLRRAAKWLKAVAGYEAWLACLRPDVREQLDAIHERYQLLHNAIRAASGCYWGQSALVDDAMDKSRKAAAPPAFRRWRGTGSLALQLRGTTGADIERGTPYFGIDLTPRPVLRRRRDGVWRPRGGRDLPRARLRVGSKNRRAPVWAEWPIVYHRPLPPNAAVVWAQITRYHVASSWQWALMLTVHEPAPAPHARAADAVAVNLGWRRTATHATIVVQWAASDGQSGEIHCPPDVAAALSRSDWLRARRDTTVEEMKASFWNSIQWSDEHRAVFGKTPVSGHGTDDEAVTRSEHGRNSWPTQWKAARRFAAHTLWWREHRWPGDEAAFEAAEAWRQHDKHLWLWEAHGRQQALARRLDGYRNAVADLATRYGTVIIERLDLTTLARDPEPDKPADQSVVLTRARKRANAQRVGTAPSEFRTALTHAVAARGGTILKVAASASAAQMLEAWRLGLAERPESRAPRSKRFVQRRAAKARQRERREAPIDACVGA